jgi:hypothetical protein
MILDRTAVPPETPVVSWQVRVPVNNIEWIEAAKDYVMLIPPCAATFIGAR